jgi:hypothetical protein
MLQRGIFMLVNLKSRLVKEEELVLMRQRLVDAYSEEKVCDMLKNGDVYIAPDMYQPKNLTTEITGRVDNNGIYPVRFEFSIGHGKQPDGIQVEKFPFMLPVLIEQLQDRDDNKEMETSRLHGYGICNSIPEFFELVGDQLESSSRQFMVSFCNIKSDEFQWHKQGPFIAKDLTVEEKQEEVFLYHVYEIEKSGVVELTSEQKLQLMGMDCRGEEIDSENLLSNFK